MREKSWRMPLVPTVICYTHGFKRMRLQNIRDRMQSYFFASNIRQNESMHFVLTYIGITLLAANVFVIQNAHAQVTVSEQPQSIEEVRDDISLIQSNINGAQCGGSRTDLSVANYLPSVWGVPGRSGAWNANISYGVAAKNPASFTFPDTAKGLSTLCQTGAAGPIVRNIWDEATHTWIPTEIEQPYFEDPPCVWRNDGTIDQNHSPETCRAFCHWLNNFTYFNCIRTRSVFDGSGAYLYESCEGEGTATATLYTCSGYPVPGTVELGRDPNSSSSSSRSSEPIEIHFPDDPIIKPPIVEPPKPDPFFPPEFPGGNLISPRDPFHGLGEVSIPQDRTPLDDVFNTFIVSPPAQTSKTNDAFMSFIGQILEFPGGEQQALDTAPRFPLQDPCEIGNPNPMLSFPNATGCSGQNCRCPGPGCQDQVLQIGTDTYFAPPFPYQSFYREYETGFSRNQVVNNQETTNFAEAVCFGFYQEVDPGTLQTRDRDRRCLIDIDLSNAADAQQVKGEFSEDGKLPDPTSPDDPQNQRQSGFIPALHTWYEDLSDAFSFAKTDESTKDITDALLAPDTAKQRTPPQRTEETPIALGNQHRSIDDTGWGVIGRWWNDQQTHMSSLLHPTKVILRLPSVMSLGIDPSSPLFNEKESLRVVSRNPRTQSIDVQLEMRDDLIAEIIHYIERTTLPLQEYAVRFVVPMGSPTDFRVLAEKWCLWWMQSQGERTCQNAPAEVQSIMQRLHEYADNIDAARELRTIRDEYLTALLEAKAAIAKPQIEALQEAADLYERSLEQHEKVSQLLPFWNEASTKMARFHSDVNMPFCMNQAFTLPLYSLLDPWLPSRRQNGERTQQGLPLLPEYYPEDIVIDLTEISSNTSSTLTAQAISIPVPKPVQLRINLENLVPPASTEVDPVFPEVPPALPNISTIANRFREETLSVQALLPGAQESSEEDQSLIAEEPNFLTEEQVFAAKVQLININSALQGMSQTYRNFWTSIAPVYKGSASANLDEIVAQKLAHECSGWNSLPCFHHEMELLETLVRMGSRAMVFLAEDYEIKTPERSFPATCMPEDESCDILPGQYVIMPEQDKSAEGQVGETQVSSTPQFIEDLRSDILDLVLPYPVGSSDPDFRFGNEFFEYIPGMGTPDPTSLSPDPPSS